MRLGNPFIEAVYLIFSAFIVLFGIFLVMLPWATHFRAMAVNFFQQQSLASLWLGVMMIVIGLAILVGLFALHRRKYYYLKMGDGAVEMGKDLLQGYLDIYWKELFPRHHVSSTVIVNRDNGLEITADLPFIENKERQKFLSRVESDLKGLLSRKMGYEKPFYVRISFAPVFAPAD